MYVEPLDCVERKQNGLHLQVYMFIDGIHLHTLLTPHKKLSLSTPLVSIGSRQK